MGFNNQQSKTQYILIDENAQEVRMITGTSIKDSKNGEREREITERLIQEQWLIPHQRWPKKIFEW